MKHVVSKYMQVVYIFERTNNALIPSSICLLGDWQTDGVLCYTMFLPTSASPSSSGLGHRPFKAVTRVRVPLGAPRMFQPPAGGFFHARKSQVQGLEPARAEASCGRFRSGAPQARRTSSVAEGSAASPVGGTIEATATCGWLFSRPFGPRPGLWPAAPAHHGLPRCGRH